MAKHLYTAVGEEPPQQPKALPSCAGSPNSIMMKATAASSPSNSTGKRSSSGSGTQEDLVGSQVGTSPTAVVDKALGVSSRYAALAELGIHTEHQPLGEGGYGAVFSCFLQVALTPGFTLTIICVTSV